MSGEVEVSAATSEGVRLPLATELVEEAVRHVLAAEGVAAAEISLAFLLDDEIAGMNEGYLAHPGATDVISFALHGPDQPPLGDIYIGVEQAERQAREYGVAFGEELLRLVVHGTLHVLGYDHPADGERESSPMYLRQEELVSSILERVRAAGR